MRMIDADALFKVFGRGGWFDNADREQAEDLILNAPTIDFETVNTACWKVGGMYPNGVVAKWICSACGKRSLKTAHIAPTAAHEWTVMMNV